MIQIAVGQGKLVSSKALEEVYVSVRTPQPEFPDGMEKLQDFIYSNLRSPRDICVNGRVIVQFAVNEDGTTSDFKVMRSLYFLQDEEALRVLKLMPKWIPAKVNEPLIKPSKTSFTVAIKF